MPTEDAAPVAAVTESLVELIRQEVPGLLGSGQNWKLIINASSAGDISTAIELHCVRLRRFKPVSQAN